MDGPAKHRASLAGTIAVITVARDAEDVRKLSVPHRGAVNMALKDQPTAKVKPATG